MMDAAIKLDCPASSTVGSVLYFSPGQEAPEFTKVYSGVNVFENLKEDGRPCTLALLDLDNLEVIRIRYGEQACRQARTFLLERLRCTLRDTDYLGEYDRYALLIFPGTNHRRASLVGTRLQREMAPAVGITTENSISLSVSVGLSTCYMSAQVEYLDLIAQAESALIEAKSMGQNSVRVYEAGA